MIQQFNSGVYIWKKKRKEKDTHSEIYKHPNAHSCTIYNSQDVDAN